MEVVKVIMHSIGIPSAIVAILNINFNTWQGWVTFSLSSIYVLSLIVIGCIKSYQSIRRENFEHKMRKRKAV